MDPVEKILSGKNQGYFDVWPLAKGVKTTVSGVQRRKSGQGEYIEVLSFDVKKNLAKVKSLEYGDSYLVEALN